MSKRIFGLILFVVGVAAIIFANHSMNRIARAKGTIDDASQFLPDDPFSKTAETMVRAKASEHDATVTWILIGGIVFVIVGGGMLFLCRKNK